MRNCLTFLFQASKTMAVQHLQGKGVYPKRQNFALYCISVEVWLSSRKPFSWDMCRYPKGCTSESRRTVQKCHKTHSKCNRRQNLSTAASFSSSNFLMLSKSYNVLYTICCKSLMACLTPCWFYLDLLHCHPAWQGNSRGFMVFNQSPDTCSCSP